MQQPSEQQTSESGKNSNSSVTPTATSPDAKPTAAELESKIDALRKANDYLAEDLKWQRAETQRLWVILDNARAANEKLAKENNRLRFRADLSFRQGQKIKRMRTELKRLAGHMEMFNKGKMYQSGYDYAADKFRESFAVLVEEQNRLEQTNMQLQARIIQLEKPESKTEVGSGKVAE